MEKVLNSNEMVNYLFHINSHHIFDFYLTAKLCYNARYSISRSLALRSINYKILFYFINDFL